MGSSPPYGARRKSGLTGPVILITVGLIFLADHLMPGWTIGKTWPILLVVIGVLKLVDIGRPPQAPRGPQT